MLKLSTFLEEYNNVLFMIKDNNNNVLYPTDINRIRLFDTIASCGINENGLYVYNKNYYEYTSQVIIENDRLYVVDSLMDVTKYEEEALQSKIDIVTNLNDKRSTYEAFNYFITQAIALEIPFACAMGDADLFKNVNDTYGHVCGDEVLKSIGSTLYNNTRHRNLRGHHVWRGKDIVGRVGGEEFLVIINNASILSSYNILNKIRKEIEKSTINYEDKIIPSCTMSFGMHYVSVDELKSYGRDETIDKIRDDILKKCDQALYVSKVNGRNCVNVFGIKSDEELESVLFDKTLIPRVRTLTKD